MLAESSVRAISSHGVFFIYLHLSRVTLQEACEILTDILFSPILDLRRGGRARVGSTQILNVHVGNARVDASGPPLVVH